MGGLARDLPGDTAGRLGGLGDPQEVEELPTAIRDGEEDGTLRCVCVCLCVCAHAES